MGWLGSQIKLFHALLYCYPAEFRHEYGAEMELLFADRLQSEPRWRVWLDALADAALSAPREHAHILVSDVKYGSRILAAKPGFTTVALLVIALGIGATTAIFSVVNAVLLQSLPYSNPQRLVYLWSPNPNFKGVPDELGPNVPDFYEWKRLSHSFSSMALLHPTAVNLVDSGHAIRVGAAYVTGDFFRTLERLPLLGRLLDASDDRPGHDRVVVISSSLWHSRFGSDPNVIGRHLQVNRENYTVVGVMPDDFGYPFDGDIPYENTGFRQTDLWMPRAYTASQKTDRVNFASDIAIGRLRSHVSPASAGSELNALQARLDPLYPEMWRGWTVSIKPLVETIIGPAEKLLWLLLGAVGVVLLIAVSNLAQLLLARSLTRAHEMGIRTALGAERARIIRQLLTESLLLSGAGGILGIAFAYAALPLLIRMDPGGIPRFATAAIDGRILLVGVGLSIVAGIAAGLAPAIAASRSDINHLLKIGGVRGTGGRSKGGRSALIVVEVALSVVLLTAAGLLIRSYLALSSVDPGFSRTALTFQLRLDDRYRTPEQRNAFYKRFLDKLHSMHGVTSAGASNSTPLSRHESVTYAEIRGFGKTNEMIEDRSVTPDYRKALGTLLLAGRDFDAHDIDAKAPVVMVNERFARDYFEGRDPLRQQIRTGIGDLSKAPWATVIGVVGNIRHNSLDEAAKPQLFQPAASGDNFAVECNIPSSELIREARSALRSLDRTLTLENIRTMSERIKESNARRRFQTTLLTGFAAIALLLALAGLYGVMSYGIKQRRAEIGVRRAVGCSRAGIMRLVLGEGLRLTTLGLAAGLAGALAFTRLVKSWLFGVTPVDPVTFAAVPVIILAVAVFACLLPAWRAASVDPATVLRGE